MFNCYIYTESDFNLPKCRVRNPRMTGEKERERDAKTFGHTLTGLVCAQWSNLL